MGLLDACYNTQLGVIADELWKIRALKLFKYLRAILFDCVGLNMQDSTNHLV
jgi:hypothetical protein